MVSKYILMAIVFSGLVITTLERIKAKIMETGKNFKNRSTIAGNPLYLTKALDSSVSVASCSVCDLARLYYGGGLRWSVNIFC